MLVDRIRQKLLVFIRDRYLHYLDQIFNHRCCCTIMVVAKSTDSLIVMSIVVKAVVVEAAAGEFEIAYCH